MSANEGKGKEEGEKLGKVVERWTSREKDWKEEEEEEENELRDTIYQRTHSRISIVKWDL